MSILMGDSGRCSVGPYKEISIQPTVVHELLTDVNMPTSKPAQPQFTYGVGAMKPIFNDNFTPLDYNRQFYGHVCGRNTGAAAATLYYELYKNSTLLFSGSISCAAAYYFTLSSVTTPTLLDTDVLSLYLWASADGVAITQRDGLIYPDRLRVNTAGGLVKDFKMTIVNLASFYSGLTVAASNWSGSWYMQPHIPDTDLFAPVFGTRTFRAFSIHELSGLGYTQADGAAWLNGYQTHASINSGRWCNCLSFASFRMLYE